MANGSVFVDSNILLHAAIPDIGSDPPEVKLQKHGACLAQLRRFLDEGVALWINGQVIREFWVQASRYETEAGPMPLAWALEGSIARRCIMRSARQTRVAGGGE